MNTSAVYTTDTGRTRHERPDCSHFYKEDTVEKSGRRVAKSRVRCATAQEMTSKPACRDCVGTSDG